MIHVNYDRISKIYLLNIKMSLCARALLFKEFRRFEHSYRAPTTWKKLGSRTWRKLDSDTRTKDFRFRVGHEIEQGKTETKAQFQAKLNSLLKELDETQEIELPRRESLLPKNIRDPLLKLLIYGSEKLRNGFIDAKSKEVFANETLIRYFAKQDAMNFELPGRYVLPKCEFESYSIENIIELLRKRRGEFFFMMHKKALRQNKQDKHVVKDRVLNNEPRLDMIPYYQLDKMYRTMIKWRIEVRPCFDNPLLFDLSFDHLMKKRALKDLSSQLMEILSHNIQQPDPLQLLLVNCNDNTDLYQKLLNVHDFPDGHMKATSKNLLELDDIEREKLVYLSPDASANLVKFDETKVYIIGGLVDLDSAPALKVTYSIAKNLGIERVKFPLRTYLKWHGRDGLSLDIVYKILHTFRATGNWAKAFYHVPRRFHHGLTEDGIEAANGDVELLNWYSGALKRINPPPTEGTTDPASFLGWSYK